MLHRVGRSVVRNVVSIVLLLAVTGGHLALLQATAWAGMLVDHLRSDAIAAAVTKTFDGNHPCPMCKAIQHGKKDEKKSEFEVKVVSLVFPPAGGTSGILFDEYRNTSADLSDESAASLSLSPPHRPPRGFTALVSVVI